MVQSNIRVCSLFSGIGGIDLGFEQTGAFKIVYVNEVDPYPVKTYELNSDIKKQVNEYFNRYRSYSAIKLL